MECGIMAAGILLLVIQKRIRQVVSVAIIIDQCQQRSKLWIYHEIVTVHDHKVTLIYIHF